MGGGPRGRDGIRNGPQAYGSGGMALRGAAQVPAEVAGHKPDRAPRPLPRLLPSGRSGRGEAGCHPPLPFTLGPPPAPGALAIRGRVCVCVGEVSGEGSRFQCAGFGAVGPRHPSSAAPCGTLPCAGGAPRGRANPGTGLWSPHHPSLCSGRSAVRQTDPVRVDAKLQRGEALPKRKSSGWRGGPARLPLQRALTCRG